MAKHLLNLDAEWTACPTDDELSGAVRVGLETVCIVGGKTPEQTNAILEHIVALRELARAAAYWRESFEGMEDVLNLAESDDHAENLAEVRMHAASVVFQQALRDVGDKLILCRDAAARQGVARG